MGRDASIAETPAKVGVDDVSRVEGHKAALDQAMAFHTRYDSALTRAFETYDVVDKKLAGMTGMTGMSIGSILGDSDRFSELGKLPGALTEMTSPGGLGAALRATAYAEDLLPTMRAGKAFASIAEDHQAALDKSMAFHTRFDSALTRAFETYDAVDKKLAGMTGMTGMSIGSILGDSDRFSELGKLPGALTEMISPGGLGAALRATAYAEDLLPTTFVPSDLGLEPQVGVAITQPSADWTRSDGGVWVPDRDRAVAHTLAVIVVTYTVGLYLTEMNRVGDALPDLNRAGLFLEAGGVAGLYRLIVETVLRALAGPRDGDKN